jgi:3-keto-5-aminohexanoate cleavage enzyme
VHCRDQNENPTSDYQTFKEAVEKIRKRTHLIIMVSTSGIAANSDEERAQPLKTDPEMASLTTGSLNFAGRKPSVVYVNTRETITYLAGHMLERNIKPELEAFDVGFIAQGIRLIKQGLVKEPPHFQLVMGVDGGIPASPENLIHMRNQLPHNATFVVAGVSKWQSPMAAMAILIGGHVRVGLEDNLLIARDKLARNEELVTQVRHLAEQLNREVATPDEARRILSLLPPF